MFSLMVATLLLTACSSETTSSTPVEERMIPHVFQEGCKFTIVTDSGTAATTSPINNSSPGVTVSASVSIGEYEIEVADCEVISNPAYLPLYE
ncbi:hypothetical protein BOW53_07320 [Solemya pervernicosa gill symbiont]|uniref:Uncharacterized protein n=1 Tax=Solemya pervernicosa gill symbiont TaxID=642797 RepID=A0A1T2L6E7_9GAMM|nr:hypothetical protein BOW53_07320 [Solemya pervernicosa gill symbiont]